MSSPMSEQVKQAVAKAEENAKLAEQAKAKKDETITSACSESG